MLTQRIPPNPLTILIYQEEANKVREEEIARREKAIERALDDHLKNEKLTQQEIWQIRDPNAVF